MQNIPRGLVRMKEERQRLTKNQVRIVSGYWRMFGGLSTHFWVGLFFIGAGFIQAISFNSISGEFGLVGLSYYTSGFAIATIGLVTAYIQDAKVLVFASVMIKLYAIALIFLALAGSLEAWSAPLLIVHYLVCMDGAFTRASYLEVRATRNAEVYSEAVVRLRMLRRSEER